MSYLRRTESFSEQQGDPVKGRLHVACCFQVNDYHASKASKARCCSVGHRKTIAPLLLQKGSMCFRSRSRPPRRRPFADRKSTRLNSSHLGISYAVFCLKKKNK